MTTTGTMLNFVGDLSLDSIDLDRFHIDASIHDLLVNADLNIANLESPLTRSEDKRTHQPIHLKAEPCLNEILDSFDVFCLANNHILDYGEAGLCDTITFLEYNKKCWFGAGMNLDEASRPLRMEVNGIKLAFLGCTRWYNAKHGQCGTAGDRVSRVAPIVRKLKADGYFVIVYAHWNYEYVSYPAPIERKRARRLIDAGVDLIVGAHPHCVHGYERYRDKTIFHSLGNFVFETSHMAITDASCLRTFVASVDLRPDHTYDTQVFPLRISSNGLHRLHGSDERHDLAAIEDLCNALCDDNVSSRLFYREAHRMVHHAMQSLSRSNARGSALWALLRRLPQARRQDFYVKLHSVWRK